MKFKLTQYMYPFEIFSLYRSLKKSEYYSFDQLVSIQNKKLKVLIEHAYNHVPYYKELFDKNGLKPQDVQTVDDLVYVPVLTKDILRERFDDLIADNVKQFNPYVNKTSGSTGTPLKFIQDKNVSIARFAFFWRAWQMAGYTPYMKWAQIDGMYVPEGNKIWKWSLPLNSLQISAYSLNEQNCLRILNKLNQYKPLILRGHPSALYSLCVFLNNTGKKCDFKLNSVITYSETLNDYQRALFKSVFKCKVYDIYSLWEAVCLISECEFGNKHQHMEYAGIEILNENNKRIEIDETGEIAGTSFYNFSMPLIRYKTRDLANFSIEQTCPCGRGGLVIENIDGRIEDVLITPEGKRVANMAQVFKSGKGFDFAQIIQTSKDKLEVLFVKNNNFSDTTASHIENELRKRLNSPDMKIEFKFVNEIVPTANGKRRLVINKVVKQ